VSDDATRIRLLACDVDGTLLDHHNTLPDDRRAAVGRLLAADVHVVLATGKIWPSIQPLWEDLGLRGPHVTCNGAAVVDGDGDVIGCTPLDTTTAVEVAEELARRHIPHAIYLDDGSLVTAERRPELDVLPALGEPDPVEGRIDERRVLKVLSVLAEEDEGDLRQLASDRARVQRTSYRFLEWNHPDADKALGLRYVVDHLGLTMDQVVAIGDAENDVPMLRAAGTGVAVAEASDAARRGADLHLTTDLATYLDEVASAVAKAVS
jgi:Cof subfamily protein (haloacid dehalogenase superfamily)